MLYRLQCAWRRFWSGRYGLDALHWLILILLLGMTVVRVFAIPVPLQIILAVCSWLLFFWGVFRALSRNTYRRAAENHVFVRILRGFTGFFVLQRNRIRDRKTHVYRRCPSCHAALRLPRIAGSHTVVCPRCQQRFDVHI